MIHVKIRFHENKIKDGASEEDIKMRERRIHQLQKDLYEVRRELETRNGQVALSSQVNISQPVHTAKPIFANI
jgi:hypothetical protein